jgi:uncharacterized repeat protein (TIGR03987 family)
MATPLVFAIVSITLALVFYTIGVWGEKLSKTLSPWNLACFWTGLGFDTAGTLLMSRISGSFTLNFHGLTGALAIVLMIFHAVWATLVLVRGNEKKKATFHRFSFIVYLLWLIPYGTGMVLHMV